MSQPDSDHLLNAAASLRAAYVLIDRLGEFFAAEHAWVFSTQEEWTRADWETKVEKVVDGHGFAIPEMFEALIHLAHSVEETLRELSEGDVTGRY